MQNLVGPASRLYKIKVRSAHPTQRARRSPYLKIFGGAGILPVRGAQAGKPVPLMIRYRQVIKWRKLKGSGA